MISTYYLVYDQTNVWNWQRIIHPAGGNASLMTGNSMPVPVNNAFRIKKKKKMLKYPTEI